MVFPLGDAEKTRIVPVVTYALLALNVGIYLLQLDRGEAFTNSYAATPYEITHGVDLESPRDDALLVLPGQDGAIPQERVVLPVRFTMLTALFLHSDPLHLALNLLFLWIFGDNVEEVLGPLWYLLFYLASGMVGTLAQVAVSPDSTIPTMGASGAIAGVMGAYLVWFPRNRVRVFAVRYVIEFPAAMVIGAWFIYQACRSFVELRNFNDVGGVAYVAHLAGALLGIALAQLLRGRARRVLHRAERTRQDL